MAVVDFPWPVASGSAPLHKAPLNDHCQGLSSTKNDPAAKMNVPAQTSELHGLLRVNARSINTFTWMAGAFIVSCALAVIVFAYFGTGDRGTGVALRVTARWSFLLFWGAYAGGALAKLSGLDLGGLAGRGRELGLAFASAQLLHVALVLWLFHVTAEPQSAMTFFWMGVLGTYLLALFSVQQLRDALGLRVWRTLCLITLEYIALVFADDFILAPLQATGFRAYPLSYLPFAAMLVAGAGLRLATFAQHCAGRYSIRQL